MSKYLAEFLKLYPSDTTKWGAKEIMLYSNFVALKEKLGTITEVEAHVCGQ